MKHFIDVDKSNKWFPYQCSVREANTIFYSFHFCVCVCVLYKCVNPVNLRKILAIFVTALCISYCIGLVSVSQFRLPEVAYWLAMLLNCFHMKHSSNVCFCEPSSLTAMWHLDNYVWIMLIMTPVLVFWCWCLSEVSKLTQSRMTRTGWRVWVQLSKTLVTRSPSER